MLALLSKPISIAFLTLNLKIARCNCLGGITCISRDTGMCHYFGYFFGVAPGFLGTFLGHSRNFGYHVLVKFDFFRNNSDLGVLILIHKNPTVYMNFP